LIKALIFDLGGVIVPFDFKRGYAFMQDRCGLAAEDIRGRIGATDLVRRYESGKVESHAFVSELCGVLNADFSYEEFCKIWYSIFLPQTLIEDELVAALGARYPLVLLSNTNQIHFEMLEQGYPILRHFRRRALSYKVGAMKPSPIIYEAAVALAGCRPGECFFTDDVPPYVEGACQAGIDAVQFQNREQLERDLRARGVEW
jgi:putative hydrolase of the HAD superfamily